jgi:hypothetical protein
MPGSKFSLRPTLQACFLSVSSFYKALRAVTINYLLGDALLSYMLKRFLRFSGVTLPKPGGTISEVSHYFSR